LGFNLTLHVAGVSVCVQDVSFHTGTGEAARLVGTSLGASGHSIGALIDIFRKQQNKTSSVK